MIKELIFASLLWAFFHNMGILCLEYEKNCLQRESISLSEEWKKVDFYVSDDNCDYECFNIGGPGYPYYTFGESDWGNGWHTLHIRWNKYKKEIEEKSFENQPRHWNIANIYKISNIQIKCRLCFSNCDEDYRVFRLKPDSSRFPEVPIHVTKNMPSFVLRSSEEVSLNYYVEGGTTGSECLQQCNKLKADTDYDENWSTSAEIEINLPPVYKLVTFRILQDQLKKPVTLYVKTRFIDVVPKDLNVITRPTTDNGVGALSLQDAFDKNTGCSATESCMNRDFTLGNGRWRKVDFFVLKDYSVYYGNCVKMSVTSCYVTYDQNYRYNCLVLFEYFTWPIGWNTMSIRWNKESSKIEMKTSNKEILDSLSFIYSSTPRITLECRFCFLDCSEEIGIFRLPMGSNRNIPIYYSDDKPSFSLWSDSAVEISMIEEGKESKYMCHSFYELYSRLIRLKSDNVDCTWKENVNYQFNWKAINQDTHSSSSSYKLVKFGGTNGKYNEQDYYYYIQTKFDSGPIPYIEDSVESTTKQSTSSSTDSTVPNKADSPTAESTLLSTDNSAPPKEDSTIAIPATLNSKSDDSEGDTESHQSIKTIGIVLGVFVGIALLCLLIFFLVRKLKNQPVNSEENNEAANQGAVTYHRDVNNRGAINNQGAVSNENEEQEEDIYDDIGTVNDSATVAHQGAVSSENKEKEEDIYDDICTPVGSDESEGEDIEFMNDLYVSFDVNPELIT